MPDWVDEEWERLDRDKREWFITTCWAIQVSRNTRIFKGEREMAEM